MKLGGGEEEEKRPSWRGRRRKGMVRSIFKDILYEFCKQFLKRKGNRKQCFCTYVMFDKEFILEVTTDWSEQLLIV